MSRTSAITLYIDPPSVHFLQDRLFAVDDARPAGDHILAPYVHLRAVFAAKGIPVHTADYLPRRAHGGRDIYVSLGRLENYRRLARQPDTVLSAFFAMECPVAEPSLYRALPDVQRYFKRLYSWSDSPSLEPFVGRPLHHLEHFRWPQSFDHVHEQLWSQTDRKFLVMINGNKLPRVSWRELYTERRRAVAFFERTSDIDLYGFGWDVPAYQTGKTWVPYTIRRVQRTVLHYWQRLHPDPLLEAARRVYRGEAKSKANTLGQYTFALCFENSIIKGWITEKIFDCFFTGTIPIYWGAPDIAECVPSTCFIDMRQFTSYADLRQFLKSQNEADKQRYRENAREYLRSTEFRPFTKQAFAEIFERIVQEDTGVRTL